MTADVIDLKPAAKPIPAPRRDWSAALKALRRLLNDKEDTGQVFEIMRALNGSATKDAYDRLLTTGQGGRMAYERVEPGWTASRRAVSARPIATSSAARTCPPKAWPRSAA
jgi:hypothetical protein